jgi:ParB family chromosome partitioning protein
MDLQIVESDFISEAVTFIPTNIIVPNPHQPRKIFSNDELAELAASIREYGVINPIIVRYNGEMYEIVAGERRLRASKLAGLREIPAIVREVSGKDSAVIALIENLQRENLNYFEEAEGFSKLIFEYSLTQEQLAKQVGKSQSAIANKLRLLKLPDSVKAVLGEFGLTERHARALLRLGDEKSQLFVLKKVTDKGLSVQETELLVNKILEERKPEKKEPKIKTYIKNVKIFTNTIRDAVDVMNHSGVETVYEIDNQDDGCLITILVNYQKEA